MPTEVMWMDIGLRLFLAAVAGAILGWDRGETGKPAGLRTTMLVCLAAALAMIQANLLNNTHGKTADTLVVMDTMRLPLGILSGMGFIGGGAILRRGRMIVGVTTAATLWFVTVIGLCFGGGQLLLGGIGFLLGMMVLIGLRRLDHAMRQKKNAQLHVETRGDGLTEESLRSLLHEAGYRIASWKICYGEAGIREMTCQVQFYRKDDEPETPAVVRQLAGTSSVLKVSWKS